MNMRLLVTLSGLGDLLSFWNPGRIPFRTSQQYTIRRNHIISLSQRISARRGLPIWRSSSNQYALWRSPNDLSSQTDLRRHTRWRRATKNLKKKEELVNIYAYFFFFFSFSFFFFFIFSFFLFFFFSFFLFFLLRFSSFLFPSKSISRDKICIFVYLLELLYITLLANTLKLKWSIPL